MAVKIMIVDDHSGIREMFRTLLSSRGVDLAECADGQEALAMYGNFHPDWVFMDSAMEHLDGLTATRELVRCHPEARIVVVSEDDVHQLRTAARAAGACGFVAKGQLLQALTQDSRSPVDGLAKIWMDSAQS